MIKATIIKSSDGRYRGFEVSGHAGFAEYGNDVVCAAVSMLVINTVNSIEEFTDDKFTVDENEKKGLISFKFVNDEVSPKAVLLLDSLVLGLTGAAKEYGDYLSVKTIRIEEV